MVAITFRVLFLIAGGAQRDPPSPGGIPRARAPGEEEPPRAPPPGSARRGGESRPAGGTSVALRVSTP